MALPRAEHAGFDDRLAFRLDLPPTDAASAVMANRRRFLTSNPLARAKRLKTSASIERAVSA